MKVEYFLAVIQVDRRISSSYVDCVGGSRKWNKQLSRRESQHNRRLLANVAILLIVCWQHKRTPPLTDTPKPPTPTQPHRPTSPAKNLFPFRWLCAISNFGSESHSVLAVFIHKTQSVHGNQAKWTWKPPLNLVQNGACRIPKWLSLS